MEYKTIRSQAIQFMLERGWKEKTAKRRNYEQSLFDHTLIEMDVLMTLFPILGQSFVPPLTTEEEQILLVSVLAHDVGKELDEWQAYVMGQRDFLSDVNRELTEEVVPQLAKQFGIRGIEEMLSNVLLHMRYERTAAKIIERVLFGGHTNPRWKTLAELVDVVDNLCSIKGLLGALDYLGQCTVLSNHLQTSYHLTQFRGVSTTLLHRAAIDAFTELGWSPLLHYSNGTIYVVSTTKSVSEPTVQEIEEKLAKQIQAAMGSDFAQQVVGHPTASMLPKPDLFDYRELRDYLQIASQRINPNSFSKKSETTRRQKVTKYLKLKGDQVPLTPDQLAHQTERISVAQPEMCIFKFFKAALAPERLGEEVIPEAQKIYADFAEGGSKRKAAQVTPQSVARAEYENVFGEGTYANLQSTSTLMPAKDMTLTIDHFWALKGEAFGVSLPTIESLLDHDKRQEVLIKALVDIANRVYDSIPEAKRPIRVPSEQIAGCFITDLIHPAMPLNLTTLISKQLQGYAKTKANAYDNTGDHLCPICNQAFQEGTEAKADFLANPGSHTNRAMAHGKTGSIVICNACKYERFLQQLLLGSKVSDVIVLFPRMNIGHDSGEILRRKAVQIWERALIRMSEANPEPDQHLSLGMTFNLARNLENREVFALSAAELVEIMTYHSRQETAKRHRRELKKGLKKLYEVDELAVEELNEYWNTDYTRLDEAIQALIDNKVTDDDARKVRADAFRLTPQFRVACQTPHLILIPVSNPISMGKESDTNAAIRELYVTLLLGLALDCSVAIVKTGEVITFEGGEGVARVPPVPALREMVDAEVRRRCGGAECGGAEWVSIEAAKRWLDAIGAAALLARDTAFPERSNLYAILKSATVGHIYRRIEQQEDKRIREGKPRFSLQRKAQHIVLLEKIKEVLR